MELENDTDNYKSTEKKVDVEKKSELKSKK